MTRATALDDLVLAVRPGSGIVHRQPGAVLLVPAPSAAQLPTTRTLLMKCASTTEDPTGRRVVRSVAGLLATADPAEVPAFGLVVQSTGGLVALVHAEAEVLVEGEEDTRLSGSDSLAWVERPIAGPVRTITMRGTAATEAAGPPADLPWDLRAGTVPGAGVVLAADTDRLASAAPPPASTAAEPSPRDEVDDARAPAGDGGGEPMPDRVILLPPPPSEAAGEDFLGDRVPLPIEDEPESGAQPVAPDEPPLPVVEGTLCSRGHFNDPDAAYCSICGISMRQRTRQTVLRPRPPLGVLVLDDGAVFALDADYVIGRDPESHPAVRDGKVRPLVLNDDINGVSRVHASVALVGWKVQVTDEGAANGTYLQEDGSAACVLQPHEPALLTSGTKIRLGRRTIAFYSYHSGGE